MRVTVDVKVSEEHAVLVLEMVGETLAVLVTDLVIVGEGDVEEDLEVERVLDPVPQEVEDAEKDATDTVGEMDEIGENESQEAEGELVAQEAEAEDEWEELEVVEGDRDVDPDSEGESVLLGVSNCGRIVNVII